MIFLEKKAGYDMKKREYHNKSIKLQTKRMLILMSILFVLLCLYINQTMQRILLSNANEHTTITAQKLENQLALSYDKMYTFSMSIAGEKDIQGLMTAAVRNKTEFIEKTEEMIAYFKILDPSIMDISLINEDTYYTTLYSRSELEELREMNQNTLFSWLGVRKSGFKGPSGFSPLLMYGREILVDGKDVGTIVISIDSSYFQLNNDDEMNSYYLLANKGEVIYSFNSTPETAECIWDAWLEESGNSNIWERLKKTYVIQSVYSEDMKCYQISALDINETNSNLATMKKLIWSCMALVAAFMFLLFRMINVRMVRPLHNFQKVIQQIRERGQRSVKKEELFREKEECSEIRQIRDEFEGMLYSIDKLNRKIFDTATDLYEVKIQKQQAELSYLRSQIDPHFLYNTLEVFRKQAIDREAPELAQMAVDMGNIFRYSTKGDNVVLLEDEISIIKSYIRIQENRFQGKFKVYYFLPKETMKIPIMKMLLQPLVENAIYHGLEPKEDKGNLYIGARMEEHELIIIIKDNGIGIEENRLKEIKRELEAEKYDTSRHVGILNTQARIRLQYGKAYGLCVESRQGDGTTITMRIPADGEGRTTDV